MNIRQPSVKPLQKPNGAPSLNWEHPLAQKLVGSWLFNGSGTVSASNRTLFESVNRSDGTLDFLGTTWSVGPNGNVVHFAGVGDASIAVGNPDAIRITADFSLSVRAKAGTTGNWQWLMGRSGGSWFGISPTGVMGFSLSAGVDKLGTTNVLDGKWHTFTVTIRSVAGGTLKLYLDGKLEGTFTSADATGFAQGPVYFGHSGNFNENLNGDIDSVHQWSRALEPSEVLQLVEQPYAMYHGEDRRLRFYTFFAPPVAYGTRAPGTLLTGGTVRQRYYHPLPLNATLNPQTCWESLTQKLLGYLGAPFRKAAEGLLWSLFSTVARELSTCTSTVVLGSGEARGGGTFTLPTTFEPITGVAGVRRVSALGALLESYTVVSWSGREVTVAGVTPPKAGDYLQVDYSYTHNGLLGRVEQALFELNILTATGTFLDAWGSWFGMTRLKTGKYGEAPYGPGQKYGSGGVEADSTFSRRIIDRVTLGRNTSVAILNAVRRLTGGSPYLVNWNDSSGNNAFIFRPTTTPAWLGEADTRKHLIWGRTSRFVRGSATNGGAFVFEVWVPSGSGYSTATLLALVNSYKPASSKAIIRYYS